VLTNVQYVCVFASMSLRRSYLAELSKGASSLKYTHSVLVASIITTNFIILCIISVPVVVKVS